MQRCQLLVSRQQRKRVAVAPDQSSWCGRIVRAEAAQPSRGNLLGLQIHAPYYVLAADIPTVTPGPHFLRKSPRQPIGPIEHATDAQDDDVDSERRNQE